MLRIGLLGAGRIGAVHARAIAAHPGSQLCCVSDVFPENAAKLAAAYGAAVRSSDDIIADPSIEAVLIATSTDTHSDLIEAAVRARKAVLCEKPVDLDLKRAQACASVVADSGQPVMLGFNRRFDPQFKALKAASAAGDIGASELLTITSFDPAPPPVSYIKVSGGLFRDMMIHDFDMAAFLMDAQPETVIATASALVDPGIKAAGDVDTAVVTMTYSDGRITTIRNSRRAAYGYDQRVELLGSEGMLQAENVRENTVITSNAHGVTAAKPTYFFLERYMSAYAAEWDAFVEMATTGTKPPVGMEEGVAALATAEAATLSAQTQTPVQLSDVLS